MEFSKKIVMINSSELTSQADFQRPISLKRVKAIRDEWDEHKMKPIQVADIEGTLYIWDGQHTAAAALLKNGNNDIDLPCIVDKMTYPETCACVAQQERNKSKHTSAQQFQNSVASGDIMDCYIQAVLDKYRIKTGPSCKADTTSAIKALRNIYKSSPLYLDRVLKIATGAWPGEKDRYNSDILEALRKIVKAHGGSFKDEEMIAKIGVYTTNNYIIDAKKRSSASKVTNLVTFFLERYNFNKSKRALSIMEAIEA